MTRKFIEKIKSESYMDFVKEAQEVLDGQHEKQLQEYMRVLLGSGVLVNEERHSDEESLNEASLTRKHFQMAADAVKAIEDKEKRKEMAQHHAVIFAKSNPRFDHARFMKAAGVEADEAPAVKSSK